MVSGNPLKFGEYEMPEDRYYNERLDNAYHILDGKIDGLRDSIFDKMDETHQAVNRLTAIVTNGLSHRTKKTEEDIEWLKKAVATKQELKDIVGKRESADAAFKSARRWKLGFFASLFIGIAGIVVRFI